MTSKIGSLMRVIGLAAVAAAVVLFVGAGCDNNSSSNNNSGGGSTNKPPVTKPPTGVNSVVGQWNMVNETDGGKTYWQFNADGTMTMYNDSGFSSAHLGGKYTQNGNMISGDFQNGSTGNGDLGGTTLSSDGKTMVLHFNEHWGSKKVYLLDGTKK